MCGGGHSKVSPFMHQATSMSSCPCFFSFQPTPLHISHFPHLHLTTSHRHHAPMQTTKWLVAHTRTLVSVLVYATSHVRVCLFMCFLFLGDLPSYTPPFRRVRCSPYMRMSCGMPRFSSTTLQDFLHAELFWALQRHPELRLRF
jgi:hypothetical protein